MLPTWDSIKRGLVRGLWSVFLICCFEIELVCLPVSNKAQCYAVVAAKVQVQRL